MPPSRTAGPSPQPPSPTDRPALTAAPAGGRRRGGKLAQQRQFRLASATQRFQRRYIDKRICFNPPPSQALPTTTTEEEEDGSQRGHHFLRPRKVKKIGSGKPPGPSSGNPCAEDGQAMTAPSSLLLIKIEEGEERPVMLQPQPPSTTVTTLLSSWA